MGTIINLPKPDVKGTVPLEQVIAMRRSRRDFLRQPLTPEQTGQLLWAAQGKATTGLFRNVPSAGATYPLEVFAATGEGLFHYLPNQHAIERLSDRDIRAQLCQASWGQEFIGAAPLTIIFAAEFTRTTNRYGERGVRYVYMEAGHAAQNVHLQAEALGLGSVAVGAFDDAAVNKVLSLPANLETVYMVAVGKYH